MTVPVLRLPIPRFCEYDSGTLRWSRDAIEFASGPSTTKGGELVTEPERKPDPRGRALPVIDEIDAGPPSNPAEADESTRPDQGPPAPGAQAVQQAGSGLGLILSLLIAGLVFVLAIAATGARPEPLRIPLLQATNAVFWIIGVAAILLAGAGAQYAERAAVRASLTIDPAAPENLSSTAWIVPVIATFAAVLLVATYHNATMMVVGPLIAFLGNAGALLARDLLDDSGDASLRTASTVHAFVIHAVAFLSLGAVYLNKVPTPIGAMLVAVIAGLLTLETLERGTANQAIRTFYSLLAAAVMALALIAVNWWQTNGWTGGAVLLVCFYLVAGILLARTQRDELRPRDLVEYGAVTLVAIAILAITA